MNQIVETDYDYAFDLSTLVFIRSRKNEALFIDGDGDMLLFYVSGNKHDRQAAVKEIMKAVESYD